MKDQIRFQAREIGFDDVAFASADGSSQWPQHLSSWLGEGRHGDMSWMAAHADRRSSPKALWPEANSVLVLALSYAPAVDPLALAELPDHGMVSVYARGQDYHDTLKSKLKELARWLVKTHGGEVKVFVDTAPVMEKPLAATTALGWQGRHTNLVSRRLGNWFFLGEIYTTLVIPPDSPHADRCGTCHQCETACPTGALAGGQMDARLCISYLTIEHKGHIDGPLRSRMGNHIYGCDICLAVCPWNKFSRPTSHAAFFPRPELMAPHLAELAQLDDAAFRQIFAGSPIKRIGRDRFVRNVLIAVGNSGQSSFAPTVIALLGDESPLVRAMAVWSLRQLLDQHACESYRASHLAQENDAAVRAEWE